MSAAPSPDFDTYLSNDHACAGLGIASEVPPSEAESTDQSPHFRIHLPLKDLDHTSAAPVPNEPRIEDDTGAGLGIAMDVCVGCASESHIG